MTATIPAPIAGAVSPTERTYTALRTSIVHCEFVPGDRLAVDDLGARYGVSSSPVREALSRLVAEGLVLALENRGFRVAPLTVDGVADLTRVRLLVEGEALRDAMRHGDDRWESDLVAAGHALGLIEQRLRDVLPLLDDDWSARHRAFHMAIYAGCRSPLLREMVGQLFDAAERYRRYSARHRTKARRKHTEHARLMQAVLSRDAVHAGDRLAEHVCATERNVTAALLAMGSMHS